MTGAPDALLAARQDARRVLLTGPVGPDGDSLGACLALQRILRDRGVACDVTGQVPPRYRWMPGARDIVHDAHLEVDAYDAVVILDGDRHRLPAQADAAFGQAALKGIVDHHASTTPGDEVLFEAADADAYPELEAGGPDGGATSEPIQ